MHRTINGMPMVLILAALAAGQIRAAEIMTPLERVATAPKGELKSPYPDFTPTAMTTTPCSG